MDGLPNATESDWLKVFFEILIEEHKGLLGPHLSLQTIEAYIQRLHTVYKIKRGIEISEAVLKDLREVRDFSCI